MLHNSSEERGVRICERNHSADTKVSEGGGGGAPGTRARDPPAACGEDHGEAGCSTAAHGGPHAGAGGCPKETVTLWRAHTGAGSWQDL